MDISQFCFLFVCLFRILNQPSLFGDYPTSSGKALLHLWKLKSQAHFLASLITRVQPFDLIVRCALHGLWIISQWYEAAGTTQNPSWKEGAPGRSCIWFPEGAVLRSAVKCGWGQLCQLQPLAPLGVTATQVHWIISFGINVNTATGCVISNPVLLCRC